MRSSDFDVWRAKARAVKIEDEIARRGINNLKRSGHELIGPCPKCGGDDRFGINLQDQVWNCRQCDKGGDVIDLVRHFDGLGFIDAFKTLAGEPPPKANGKPNGKHHGRSVVVAEYPYQDEIGNTVSATERIEFWNTDGTSVLKDGKRKKTFKQKRPDPDRPSEWIYDTKGCRVVPYRLPQLIEAIASGHPIYIVEGEGCWRD